MTVRIMAAGIVAGLLAASPLDAAESFAEAFTEGDLGVAFRYRYEFVDQDNFDLNAKASTLRSRINFKTADWYGFSAKAEVDWVAEIAWDEYNAGGGNTPDRTEYPVVADPDGLDLNQAWLQWKGQQGSLLRGGRQRIIYDNARFVGNVGWRQNEQTYDAGYFQHKAGGFDVQLAYVWQVNRIFGDDVPAGRHDNKTWLANAARSWDNVGKLTGYYYDIDNQDAAAFSTRTYGLRFAGKRKLDSMTVGYTAEYAHQNDSANNPVDYSADYWRFDLSVTIGPFTPYAGYESLGGDDMRAGAAFRTPLATLHAFNGWADKFLTTPDAGLNDIILGIKGSIAGTWNWNVVYHDFRAESGGARYGKELDASIGRSFAEHYGVLLKAARFKGERGSVFDDTTKVWLQATASFDL